MLLLKVRYYLFQGKKGKTFVVIYQTNCMNDSKVLIVDDDSDDVEILAEAFT